MRSTRPDSGRAAHGYDLNTLGDPADFTTVQMLLIFARDRSTDRQGFCGLFLGSQGARSVRLDAAQTAPSQATQDVRPEGSASEALTCMPITSRHPSVFAPMAMLAVTETILPASRTFRSVALIHGLGQSPRIGRSREVYTRSSISAKSRET